MFRVRSTEKELLDADYIPEKDLFRNLCELDFINKWLGGYDISFAALKKVLTKGKTYRLVDIGSGGGDTLKRLAAWKRKNGWEMELYGIDIKPVCILYAETHAPDSSITYICDDYKNAFRHIPKLDILHASLFCHHLSRIEIVELIRFSRNNGVILVVNDLERSGLPYYLIKILTAVFSKSYLVKHDAPLSVAKGFKRKEWLEMILEAGAIQYSVKNKWAFRHEVIVYP